MLNFSLQSNNSLHCKPNTEFFLYVYEDSSWFFVIPSINSFCCVHSSFFPRVNILWYKFRCSLLVNRIKLLAIVATNILAGASANIVAQMSFIKCRITKFIRLMNYALPKCAHISCIKCVYKSAMFLLGPDYRFTHIHVIIMNKNILYNLKSDRFKKKN